MSGLYFFFPAVKLESSTFLLNTDPSDDDEDYDGRLFYFTHIEYQI